MLAYLCGPIEFAEDGGKLWRRNLTPFLTEKLGHRVYDPAEDEMKSLTEEEVANFREWKSTDIDRFRRTIRKIMAFDLDLIENKADYVICYWPEGAKSGGTSAEMTLAYRKNSGLSRDSVAGGGNQRLDDRMRGPRVRTVEELKEFLVARFAREKQHQLWKKRNSRIPANENHLRRRR